MPANVCIPYFDEADNVTCTASPAVTGKRFVDITGNLAGDGTFTVGPPSAAGIKAFGVAEYDAQPGQWVGVIREGIVPIRPQGPISAGALVQTDANGQVQAWGGVYSATSTPLGKCLNAVTAADVTAGNDAMIALDLQ